MWLGWAYLTKKSAIAVAIPIAIAFKFCVETEKMGP
jgi:hypothetical protein